MLWGESTLLGCELKIICTAVALFLHSSFTDFLRLFHIINPQNYLHFISATMKVQKMIMNPGFKSGGFELVFWFCFVFLLEMPQKLGNGVGALRTLERHTCRYLRTLQLLPTKVQAPSKGRMASAAIRSTLCACTELKQQICFWLSANALTGSTE